MGTRNLTIVQLEGNYRVAQYCQWDGYPSGQGMTILQFLQTADMEKFRAQVGKTRVLSDEELKNLWTDCGADPNSDMVTLDVSEKFNAKYPHLHRNCGGEILDHIQNSKDGLAVRSDITFAGDSLFCEWAYVIDLDKGTFEVYRGFNQEPLDESERFASLSEVKAFHEKEKEYYPVKLAESWKLDALPSEEDFLGALEEPEEEDEDVANEPAVDSMDQPGDRKVDWE